MPRWMAMPCFGVGILGVYAHSLGPCDGFHSPPNFCLFSGMAAGVFGCWFWATELLQAELQTGCRPLHLTASMLWVFVWGLEILWGGALLATFGGHQPVFDATLFVHSSKPCALGSRSTLLRSPSRSP